MQHAQALTTIRRHRARAAGLALCLLVGQLASPGARAQAVWDMASTPLLGGDNLVAPNLIFMFDDSESMTAFKGAQYPYCMDQYRLNASDTDSPPGLFNTGARRGDPKYGFVWRVCSLYGDNMKTGFDFAGSYPNYADPTRLSGDPPYRDLRTLVIHSATFNPLYYNPDVRYKPWPGWPNADPKAARPLSTDPPRMVNGAVWPAVTSTFNLVNNAPLQVDDPDYPTKLFYIDETGKEVLFPPEFKPLDFRSNTVIDPYRSPDSRNGYNVVKKLLTSFNVADGGYTDSSGGNVSKPSDGCFTYDGSTKKYKLAKALPAGISAVAKVSDAYYNSAGGAIHWVFSPETTFTITPGAKPLCTPSSGGYQVYSFSPQQQVQASDVSYSSTSPFFLAQYAKFIGDPTKDSDIINMANYITVKIDKPESAIPAGTTLFPPDPYVKGANRTDCSDSRKCTLAEEQTNFANWFSYYKTKRGMAIGTVAQAFANLPGNFRVGWGMLSKGTGDIDGVKTSYLQQGVRQWDKVITANGKTQTTAQHFMDWIATMGTSGTTSLREELGVVGQYFRRTDNAGPWGNSPGNATDNTAQLSCRRNYHIAITDGAWTGSGTVTNPITGQVYGNVDGSNQGGNYTPALPYKDSWSNTLADVSMYYWANDLRPDMGDTVNSTPTDPANWQHLTNYYLMINLSKTIDGDSASDIQALTAGTKTWPDPSGGDAQKIDDTLHAAMNSRGKLFHVTGPDSVVNAISSIQRDMSNSRGGSDAQVQVSGQYLSASSKKYKPSYTTIPWGGDLVAIALNSDGSEGAQAWSATDRLRITLPANRKIYTRDTSGAVTAFSWSTLKSASSASSLLSYADNDWQNLANYLRGDRSLEGQGFRYRGSALGDIINASPLLVGSSLDMQYDLYTGSQTTPNNGKASYRSFLDAKKARAERVYVGANDGMLHGFHAATGDEEFAYIPKAVLGKYAAVSYSSPTYSHSYFVDGQLTELDAYDNASSVWRNVLVGTAGAGAKAVFGVRLPTGAGAAAPGQSDALWEISDANADFAELGYTLNKLESGLMRNGQFAVLINNGYGSRSAGASLYVVNALTGALIRRIDTGVGSNTTAGKNGLGGVRVIRNSAREIVAAYAGDLQGNLWKFDLSDPSSANWSLAFASQTAKKPLFKAPLAITAAPGLIAHPLGGLMVIFGTGKMFENSDPGTTDAGYLYSVWDRDPVGAGAAASTTNLSDSSSLVAQSLSATDITQTDGSTKTFYTVSSNKVDYATKRGWYMQLLAGERVIYDPQAALGRIYVESVARHTNASNAAITCNPSSFDVNGYLLDPFTGAYNAARPTLDTNGDGKIDSNDKQTVVGVKTPTIARASVMQSKGTGNQGVLVTSTDQKVFNGNQALARRSWRQIVTPP